MKKTFVFHPFLFGISPVLFIFAYNIEEVFYSDIVLPLAIVLGFTLLSLSSLIIILRNKIKAAIVVSIFLILFFSYGQIAEIVRLHLLIDIFFIHAFLMFVFVAIFMWCVYFVIRTHRELHNFTSILNITAFSLVIIPIINIGIYNLKTGFLLGNIQGNIQKAEESKINTIALKNTDKLPDIYYIILDQYASSNTLKESYNFINSEFIDYLSNKGFYVASQSRANYLGTNHSLASSLNMGYIDYLADEVGINTNSWAPLYALFNDFKVWRFLRQYGYKFIYFGTGHWQSIMRKYLYKNLKKDFPSDFLMTLYSTTMLYPFGAAFNLDKRHEKWKEIQYLFEKLTDIPKMKESTFVFAHIYVPHWPYVFDRDGNFVTRWDERKKSISISYLDQLVFTNKMVKALIDELLSNSEIPPIIILQSDEGPYPQRYRVGDKDESQPNWKTTSDDEIRKKFGIFNAYYLSGVDKNILYPSITPVNSFRLIFNLYFSANFELLPDESYAFESFRHPYKFFKVTDKNEYD